MNWVKVNKLMVIIFSIFMLFFFPAIGFAPLLVTPDEYFFEQGKEALEHQDLWGAHYSFEEALYINPYHQGANLFYALTRVLMISNSTNFNKLLTRAGMSTYGRDIFDWTADFKRDPSGNILLPSGFPTGKEWQDFLKKDVLPQVDGALDNLSNVPNTYGTTFRWIVENGLGYYNTNKTFIDITKSWTPDEWAGYKLLINGTEYTIAGNTPIQITLTSESPDLPSFPSTLIYDIFGYMEIDGGDVLILKGSLYMAKAVILALNSYDLNIDIDAIVTLCNSAKLDIQRDIINRYKNFLNLLSTEQLFEAKSALREAINVFTQAINFIVGEPTGTTTPPTPPDPNQEDDLFVIDCREKEQEFRELLEDLNNSLDGTTLMRKIGLDVNLGEFFDYPKNLRGYLPIFVGSSYIKRGSFFDPTFGGILPSYLDQDGITHRDMTREELEKRFENTIRESYPITPLVPYDNFLGSKIDTNKWRGGELVREIIKTGDYVYDDFSGATIDNKKWRQGNLVREIQGGKLLMKHTSPNPVAVPSFPNTSWNQLIFSDPNSVDSIQADVAVLEDDITNSAQTRARLEGYWYNDGDGTPGTDRTGDVWADISIYKDSGNFVAKWGVVRVNKDDETDYSNLGGGNFTTDIKIGSSYTLYIGYNTGTNEFEFRVGSEKITFSPPSEYARERGANKPWKSLTTRVQIDDADSSGYVSATFDNVYANGFLYDNFTLPIINPAKWTTYEYAREIKAGKFRSKVRSSEAYVSPVQSLISFAFPSTIDAFQAKVTPLTYKNPEGLYQRAAIDGVFFNDGTSGGGSIGDVFAQVRIGGTGTKPVAEWEVLRLTNEAGTSSDLLASGKFKTAISLGKTYVLFLGWDGTKFTLKINSDEAKYTPTTGTYPVKVPSKRISTLIAPEADKKEGTIEALFDDVTVIVGSDYKLLSKVASPNPSTVSTPTVETPYNADNKMYFPDANSVNSIGAEVMVLENSITGKAHTRARMAGFWYNDGTLGTGTTGDVQAEIALRKEPTGFRVNWFIWKSTNPEGTTGDDIASGNFKVGVTTGVTYPLYISYDSVNHEFKFKVGGEEVIVNKGNTPNLPDPDDVNPLPKTPWKEITTRVQIQDPGASGYISATVDNVYRNGDLYDDFSSSTIDKTKWLTYESVQEISGGKFRSRIRSSSATTSSTASRLELLYPSEISAIQTKVTPLTYQNKEGTYVWPGRIAGFFYNDGTQGGGKIGDVGAHVVIGGSGENPVAYWTVWRHPDFEGKVVEVLETGTFNTPISLAKTYTLYLGWDGIKFIFKINSEVAYYEPETGVYPPNNPWRSIETQIFNANGREAISEALFDDVMVSGPLPSVLPASNNFGNLIAPTVSPVKIFTLLNTGSTGIGINSIDLVGDDTSMFDIVSTTCPSFSSTLPPKGKCNIVTSFRPTSEGEKSAAIRFILNTPGKPAIFTPLTGTGVLETISIPTTPVGIYNGTTGTTYTFTTGGSSSSLGSTHSVQYLFDWDDGTNSGWLPVGTKSAKKIWASSGTYSVKAMARCSIHKAVVSSLSSGKEVNITFPIHPTSPLYEHFNVDSLYPPNSPPIFRWDVDVGQSFASYEIQFSSDYRFKSIPVKVKALTISTAITTAVWKTILSIPGKSGGVVYWRVVGTRSDKSIATGEITFIIVIPPQAVEINTPLDGANIQGGTPPTFNFNSNSNIKFRLEFSPINDFSDSKKVIGFAYTIANPVIQPIMNWTLSRTQWVSVRKLMGAGGYFRIKAWDTINRETVTGPRSFTIESSLIGTWDIKGTMKLTLTIPGRGSYTESGRIYDTFTFNADGTFTMTDMTGTWVQEGTAFTIYLSPTDLEKYFEQELQGALGTNVNVYDVVISNKGTEDWMSDTISGTMNLTAKMDIPALGIIGGKIKVISTWKGTRQPRSLRSMLEGITPKEEGQFLNIVGKDLNKIIRARSQLSP
jgi:hypothetical protein